MKREIHKLLDHWRFYDDYAALAMLPTSIDIVKKQIEEVLVFSEIDEDERMRYDLHVSGKNVAYCIVYKVSTEGDGPWVKGLWVHEDWRRMGVGRWLMTKVLELQSGVVRLRARAYYRQAGPQDEALVKFYKSLGFKLYDDENRMYKP